MRFRRKKRLTSLWWIGIGGFRLNIMVFNIIDIYGNKHKCIYMHICVVCVCKYFLPLSTEREWEQQHHNINICVLHTDLGFKIHFFPKRNQESLGKGLLGVWERKCANKLGTPYCDISKEALKGWWATC